MVNPSILFSLQPPPRIGDSSKSRAVPASSPPLCSAEYMRIPDTRTMESDDGYTSLNALDSLKKKQHQTPARRAKTSRPRPRRHSISSCEITDGCSEDAEEDEDDETLVYGGRISQQVLQQTATMGGMYRLKVKSTTAPKEFTGGNKRLVRKYRMKRRDEKSASYETICSGMMQAPVVVDEFKRTKSGTLPANCGSHRHRQHSSKRGTATAVAAPSGSSYNSPCRLVTMLVV